jgi:cell division protein ZapA
MSEQLKIKLSIANRVYPLTIAASQEEGLRIAAQKIDATVKKFEQNYSVQDKQDVLAMCALQFAAESEQTKINKNSLSNALEQRLVDLNQRLEQHLDADVL